MTPDAQVFARIPALAALDPASIRVRPMPGHTNAMYALATPVGGFALRLPRPGAAALVDRQGERQALAAASRLGLAPPPLFFDPADGTMLTRCEPGRSPRTARELCADQAAMAALGRLLRRLHDAPIKLPWTFVATEVVGAHFARIDLPGLGRRLMRLAASLDRTAGQRVPAHDDVNPGNILWQGERPWLIDWEYAGMNDPAFDLATARIELALEDGAFTALLQGWGRDDAAWRERIEAQATLAHGIAGAWYLDQGNTLGQRDLIRLGRDHLERCDAGLGREERDSRA